MPFEVTTKEGVWTGTFYLERRVFEPSNVRPAWSGWTAPGEDRAPLAGGTGIVFNEYGYTWKTERVGAATDLAGIAKVAIVGRTSRTLRTCRYRDSQGGFSTTTLTAEDADVRVYDRRSGRLLASKRFRADGRSLACKSSTTRSTMHRGTTASLPEGGKAALAWARAEVAK